MNGALTLESGILLKILVAALLGGMIGMERDKHGRAAGLRTHLLVSLGAAVFTILSEIVARRAMADGFMADPGRISAQIVTGIGFLGAGVILKSGVNVRGLTTAACLWTAAAIGMTAGSGLFLLAAVVTAVALVSLILLKRFEKFYRKDSYRVLTVVTGLDVSASQIIEAVQRKHLQVLSCDIMRDFETERAEARLSIRIYHKGITDKLAHGIIDSLEISGIKLKTVHWGRS
jgi:putative Mg2+ transporter-C (MgtC) family protein